MANDAGQRARPTTTTATHRSCRRNWPKPTRRIGLAGMCQINDTYDGADYVLVLSNERMGQFYEDWVT